MVTDPELIDDFINWRQKLCQLTAATINHNRSTLTVWARFLSGREGRKNSLRYADTESVVAYIDKRKTVDGVKDVTISDSLCILRTFYNYLIHFGGTTNPTGSLPAFVCNGNYEGEYLTIDEMFAMLDTVDTAAACGARDYCIIAIFWSLGLRTSELLHLQWRDIDLEEGTLLVRNGKGRKQRQLFLNDKLSGDLQKYRKRVLGGPSHPVFCSRGTRAHAEMSSKELLTLCRTTAELAGIASKVTPLTLRHTFATHMYQAGVAVRDIQEMMGHTTITETTVYLHVTAEAAKRVLNGHVYSTHHYRGEQ
ncbi:MAG: tyrosine-type recombinase/integrase [Candidatus Pacearchaeota archaeon]|nr:tyrosine-type recombinase/integrase [Candidatus Pacearchaeota archaeon]